jgi:hypothetical protein
MVLGVSLWSAAEETHEENNLYNNFVHDIIYNKKKNTVVLGRKRTMPTERPPLVGEVSANFRG